MVESRCGAVALGRTYLLPPLSSGGALVVPPWLRFHIPLIEPDRRISRIRLSDKTSRFRACEGIGGLRALMIHFAVKRGDSMTNEARFIRADRVQTRWDMIDLEALLPSDHSARG